MILVTGVGKFLRLRKIALVPRTGHNRMERHGSNPVKELLQEVSCGDGLVRCLLGDHEE